MSNLPLLLNLGNAPGDPAAESAREAFRKSMLAVNEMLTRVEDLRSVRSWDHPANSRSLIVQPRMAESRPADGLFRSIDHANGWNIANPPVGPYQPTLYELQPAFYGAGPLIGIPGGIYVGRARETTTFEDGPGGPTIVLASGMVVDNVTIWGSNNPGTFSIVGDGVRGVYIRADLLSAIRPVAGRSNPVPAKSRGMDLSGDWAGVFKDGVDDLDHTGSLPGYRLRGVGQECDTHFGFRERPFIDMFHAQDAFIFEINNVRGVYFYNATIRGVRGFRVETGGENVSPMKLTHLQSDGVTLAPGETLALHDGGGLERRSPACRGARQPDMLRRGELAGHDG